MSTAGPISAGSYPPPKRKEKQITKPQGRFRRWLLDKLSNNGYDKEANQSIRKPEIDLPDNKGMQFSVYAASGGKIIKTSRFDQRTDNWIHGLYIVTPEQDLGQEINKIITMELLR